MPDPLIPFLPPGDDDPAIRPRAAPSRHFRKPAEEPAASPDPASGSADISASDREELERLTKRFDAIVGRNKPPEAEVPGEEETPARRKPMPRSGNVNMSVLLGRSSDAVDSGASSPAAVRPSPRYEAPRPTLPAGLGPLVWKLTAVALVMFGLGYLAASLLVRPPSASPEAPAPPAPSPPAKWSVATIDELDKALAADRAGDLKGAIKLVAELSGTQATLPGLARYLANLQIRDGNFVTPEPVLQAMCESGREAPQAFYLRAFSAARQRRFDDAFKLLQASLVLDPLQAGAYFQASEVMRRQGKLTDAVSLGKEALLRVRPGYGVSRSTIALKTRLGQIESGQTAEVEAALSEALKSPPVAPEWMFTAAALSLQRGNRPDAAEWLGKARLVMSRDEFNFWVDDYFFRGHTSLPELAAFRLTEEDRRLRKAASWEFFIDP